jgi:hypothetical protein
LNAGSILIVMVGRHFAAVVLALAVAFAPVALDACEAACATLGVQHRMDAAAGAGHSQPAGRSGVAQSCHHPATADASRSAESTAPADVTAAAHSSRSVEAIVPPHTCSHGDELPVTVAAPGQLVVHAPAVLPFTVDLSQPGAHAGRVRFASITRDSIPIILTLPLRV